MVSLILSNSSMQQIPRSLRTKAPLSSTRSPVSGSCVEIGPNWYLAHVGGETDRGGPFSGSVDSPRGERVDAGEELGLACSRVSAEENVDVGADGGRSFLGSPEEHAEKAFFDVAETPG